MPSRRRSPLVVVDIRTRLRRPEYDSKRGRAFQNDQKLL
jgi:hypothetical protein